MNSCEFAVMLTTSPAEAKLSSVRDAEDRPGTVKGRAAEGWVAFEFVPSYPLTLLIKADGYDEAETSIPEAAIRLLQPFFAGDRLQEQLPAICREAQ